MKRANPTRTEIASLIENFLDNADYKELFDDVYFDELHEIMEKIDDMALSLENQLEELKDYLSENEL